ncbi:hypothetical protein QFC21_002416 [Naganishia friedmannii]|uniref:Uncharacterized protein n=1 Tax=Naganishia friedmannii TaxID=89922 RepID=A0ACC2VY08_9TREE|nr:hypothetical protein QFC21_002416 [Naganishia friedmannii]
MSVPNPTRPSPSKQQLLQMRKRRHSAVSNNGSEDEDGDEPLASLNPAAKATITGTGAAPNASATTAGGRKRAAKAAGWNPASVDLLTVGHAVDYRYSTEISQMIYVFCEIQDPVLGTVHLIEDIVRGQLIELITRARLISHLRASRYLSAEDLIFLIRDDRAKVNRLRTYLSWKEVRKNAKKDDQAARGGADIEVEDLDDVVGKKQVIKLPWELITPFQELLRNLPNWKAWGMPDDEDNDDEELEAYEDTKRFRDFINASAFLDVKPNEDVMDILGFLAFEMVRTLCMAGLQLRNQANSITKSDLEKERIEAERMFKEREEAERIENEEKERLAKEAEEQQRQEEVEQRLKTEAEQKEAIASSDKAEGDVDPENRKDENNENIIKEESDIMMSSPGKPVPSKETSTVKPTTTEPTKNPPPLQASPKKPTKQTAAQKLTGIAALLPPPTASQAVPLLPAHILGAYSTIQREQARTKNGGLRDWRGGAPRSRAKLL